MVVDAAWNYRKMHILKYILEIWKQFSVEKKCQKNNNKISKDGYWKSTATKEREILRKQNRDFRFWFSCKEFRSHHSVLITSENLNRFKKSTTLLESVRDGQVQGKPYALRDWKDRQVNTGWCPGLLDWIMSGKHFVQVGTL